MDWMHDLYPFFKKKKTRVGTPPPPPPREKGKNFSRITYKYIGDRNFESKNYTQFGKKKMNRQIG